MKNLVLALLVLFCADLSAQADVYLKLKKFIQQSHPEITTNDKLLAFNVWSVDDAESREANKSFDKAYTVYEYAKLKGGVRGVVVVAISKENLSSMATIAITRDGIKKLISVGQENFGDLPLLQNGNAVFDSSGNEIYKNLPATKVFSSFNQLITR